MAAERYIKGKLKGVQLAAAAFALSLILFLAVVGVMIIVLTQKTTEGSETHQALCALIGDYENRVDASRQFLRTHPDGLPGIASPSQIRVSLLNQERTLAALSVVDC